MIVRRGTGELGVLADGDRAGLRELRNDQGVIERSGRLLLEPDEKGREDMRKRKGEKR